MLNKPKLKIFTLCAQNQWRRGRGIAFPKFHPVEKFSSKNIQFGAKNPLFWENLLAKLTF